MSTATAVRVAVALLVPLVVIGVAARVAGDGGRGAVAGVLYAVPILAALGLALHEERERRRRQGARRVRRARG